MIFEKQAKCYGKTEKMFDANSIPKSRGFHRYRSQTYRYKSSSYSSLGISSPVIAQSLSDFRDLNKNGKPQNSGRIFQWNTFLVRIFADGR